MNKPIVITKTETITLPPPPETHYYIPHRDEGITIRKGDLLCSTFINRNTWVPADSATWSARLKLPDTCYLARPRPYNPENLTDEILAALPDNARWLSKEEWQRLKDLGGLRVEDEALLWYTGGEWLNHIFGGATDSTYATLHPEGYYLTLAEEHFRKGKQKLDKLEKAKATLPDGCELITDPSTICQKGDFIWGDKWIPSVYSVGQRMERTKSPFIARPKAKPVWNPENLPQAEPKFKVGDKVIYVYKPNPSLWTVDSVTIKQGIPYYGIKSDNRIDYVCEPVLQAAKLVPWTFVTRPAGLVFIRHKGNPDDVMLVLNWTPDYVLLADGHWPQWKSLLEEYEWSPDGKNNWQPCGRYVDAE